jgi:hypothetical protein
VHKRTVLSLASGGALSLAILSTSSPSQAEDDFESDDEIGLSFAVTPGLSGALQNPSVLMSPGLAFTLGHTIRYHFNASYSYMSDHHGVDIQPITIGIPIHLMTTPDVVGFAIEPVVNIIGVELYFGGDGVSYLFETGVGLQGVLNFESVYFAISPLNLQLRFLAGGGVLPEGGFGFGLNLPIRVAGGLRF